MLSSKFDAEYIVRRHKGDLSMTASITGSCACGAICYECKEQPIAMLNCHCQDCQRSSGAPFASGIVVAVSATEITGNPKTYIVHGNTGGVTTRSFCADCGTPLFTCGEAVPDLMSIRFPTLDNQSWFKPMLDIWTSRAQPWVCLSQEIPHFPESP
jgi:hypothetical protein